MPVSPGDASAPARALPASAPRSPSTGRWAVIAVVLVVAGAALVAGVWAADAGWFGRSSRPSATAVPYSSASSAALAASSGYAGGGWSVIYATGYQVASAIAFNVSALLANALCPMQMAAGIGASPILFPGDRSSVGTGSSAGWEFVLGNASGGQALVVVVNGTATPIARTLPNAHGMDCSNWAGYRAMPGDLIDSTAAVAAANRAGGSSFLASYPEAIALINVIGGYNFAGFPAPPSNASWSVLYTECGAVGATSFTSHAFSALVNGTTGAVVNATTILGPCTGSGSSVGFPVMPMALGHGQRPSLELGRAPGPF